MKPSYNIFLQDTMEISIMIIYTEAANLIKLNYFFSNGVKFIIVSPLSVSVGCL